MFGLVNQRAGGRRRGTAGTWEATSLPSLQTPSMSTCDKLWKIIDKMESGSEELTTWLKGSGDGRTVQTSLSLNGKTIGLTT